MWMNEYTLGRLLVDMCSSKVSNAPVQGGDGPRMLHYGILDLILPLYANVPLKLEQLDGMTACNVDSPVVDKQCGRDGTSNLVDPICEAPVENLEEKREAIEGSRNPVAGETGGVSWLEEAEGGVAGVGGRGDGGGGESLRGVSTIDRTGHRTAIEDYASREERDDNKRFYDDAKHRRLCIQLTIVRKRLDEGGSRVHKWRGLGQGVRGMSLGV